MTASELAFLGLGLLLGAASGAALFVLLGSRMPRREIRVTVTPNAVPRRSETLSQDAFVTSPGEPARGGPGDRRMEDRAPDPELPTVPLPAPAKPVGIPVGPALGGPFARPQDRTIVPTGPGRPALPAPEPRLRPPLSTTVPVGAAAAVSIEERVERETERDAIPRPWLSPMERMLRGEHRAMAEVLDAVAGDDSLRRREWEVLLGGLVEAMADVAVQEAVLDFPMGTAFWDTFTIEQCRRIVGALASMGYAYDGRDGWVENRTPAYRDLAQALADVGVDPRRIRAWPNSSDIATLFDGARPAPEELLAAAGPDYEVDDMRELVGGRADELADLWLAWEVARPALFEERPEAV